MSSEVDRQYYQAAPDRSIAARVMAGARQRMYRDFFTCMRPMPTDRVLDVGVSDVVFEGTNFLEQKYPYKRNIVACGLGDGRLFQQAHPEMRYVKIEPNVALPFADRSFEIATSNAVLEHTGSFENQVFFVRELSRVAQRVFISVPNRFFPVEHHTLLPFVHYDDRVWRLACRLTGKDEWMDERNLIFMTPARLRDIAASIPKTISVAYTGLSLGPFSSNIYLVLQ